MKPDMFIHFVACDVVEEGLILALPARGGSSSKQVGLVYLIDRTLNLDDPRWKSYKRLEANEETVIWSRCVVMETVVPMGHKNCCLWFINVGGSPTIVFRCNHEFIHPPDELIIDDNLRLWTEDEVVGAMEYIRFIAPSDECLKNVMNQYCSMVLGRPATTTEIVTMSISLIRRWIPDKVTIHGYSEESLVIEKQHLFALEAEYLATSPTTVLRCHSAKIGKKKQENTLDAR